jgi:hypothetical protein
VPSLPFLYNDFHGGLNTKDAPYLLTDDECRDVNNVQGTTAGAIVKRGGLVTFASPANSFTSLTACEATTSTFLVGADATNLYSVSTGGTVTSLKSGLSNVRWDFISAPSVAGQGPLYCMNGTDAPQQWTGSGSTANWTATDPGGTLPNGTFCIYANNQAFVSGVAASPYRVYYSGFGDPTAWNPANNNGSGFIDFDPGDGQPITAVGTVGPYVLIGKARKLYVIVTPGNASASTVTRRLSSDIGCIAHRSISSDPNGTYFLAEDRGVYLTNGSKIESISDKIQPTIDSFVGSRALAVGQTFAGHYYLSVPLSTGTNDTILDWDATLSSWWKHTFGENDMAVWHPTGTAELFGAKGASPIVDQCFVAGAYQDNGVNTTWSWYGPWQSPTFYRRRRFPTPYFRKNFRQIRVDGAGQIDFGLATDFAGGPLGLGSNILNYTGTGAVFGGNDGTFFGGNDGSLYGASAEPVGRQRFYSAGVHNAVSPVFSCTANAPALVYSYVLMVTDRKDLVVS